MCLLSALEKSAVEALSGEKYWQRFSFFVELHVKILSLLFMYSRSLSWYKKIPRIHIFLIL